MPLKPIHPDHALTRPRPVAVRLMVWFVVWWVARLPVAVPDFHEVDHHHDTGQTCLYHEHLSRWHAEQNTPEPDFETNHDARLHWHWLIPGWVTPESQPDDDKIDPEADPNPVMIVQEPHRFDIFASFINDTAQPEKALFALSAQPDVNQKAYRDTCQPIRPDHFTDRLLRAGSGLRSLPEIAFYQSDFVHRCACLKPLRC